MNKPSRIIGFIGAGNMGEAMIGAMIRSGIRLPQEIMISDPDPERTRQVRNRYSIEIAADNFHLFEKCDTIVLAVKPQAMVPVVTEIAHNARFQQVAGKKQILSIAAGIPIQTLESIFYPALGDRAAAELPIIRVMPNTPALVLSGMSGISGNRHATAEDMEIAREIIAAMGAVAEVEEHEMDAVTAVSGSGPAYVFYLAESMIEAGLGLGLEPKTAVTLVLKTIEGAVKLMLESPDPPETLRKNVTSPGGTTEAAFQVLTANQAKATMIEAITRAAERSRELSS